jgi:two-component system, OmpR family, response regulator
MPQGDILVVDEDPDIAAMINDVLRDEGYTVPTAADGLLALAALEADHLDLLLLDLNLPGMQGLEALHAACTASPESRCSS